MNSLVANGVVTINEAREAAGFKPVPDGDKFFLPPKPKKAKKWILIIVF